MKSKIMLEETNDIQYSIKEILRKNWIKRFINNIPKYFTSNLHFLENNNWNIIKELNELKDNDSKQIERKVADKLTADFGGFGPKQARNFLQALGLTKYEIPIDSRAINWLNDFRFPVALTGEPLGDNGYYHFVSDGIQELCKKAEIYPCLLDAAIFSSFDNGEWTDEKTIF